MKFFPIPAYKFSSVLYLLVLVLSTTLLFHCNSALKLKSDQVEPYKYKVNYQSVYSSTLDGKELPGTQFHLEFTETYQPQAENGLWQREILSKKRKGFNKNLLPQELFLGFPFRVSALNGPESLFVYSDLDDARDSIFGSVHVQSIKFRLIQQTKLANIRDHWFDTWILKKSLPKGTYTKGQSLSIQTLKQQLKTVIPDSLIIEGARKRNERKCIGYALYYHQMGSLQIPLEQFFATFSRDLGQKQFNSAYFFMSDPNYGSVLQDTLWTKEKIQGRWYFETDIHHGTPCYESRRDWATVKMSDEKTERVQTTLNSYFEKIYSKVP